MLIGHRYMLQRNVSTLSSQTSADEDIVYLGDDQAVALSSAMIGKVQWIDSLFLQNKTLLLGDSLNIKNIFFEEDRSTIKWVTQLITFCPV